MNESPLNGKDKRSPLVQVIQMKGCATFEELPGCPGDPVSKGMGWMDRLTDISHFSHKKQNKIMTYFNNLTLPIICCWHFQGNYCKNIYIITHVIQVIQHLVCSICSLIAWCLFNNILVFPHLISTIATIWDPEDSVSIKSIWWREGGVYHLHSC